jgi:hypothetical protein
LEDVADEREIREKLRLILTMQISAINEKDMLDGSLK